MRRPTLRREGDTWRSLLGLALAALFFVLAVIGLLAHVVATPWQWSIVVASGAHYLMWAAVVALVIALLARRWIVVVLAVVATGLGVLVQLPPTIAGGVAANGPSLTVMQANLRLGDAEAKPIVRLVRANHVDLLATEELTDQYGGSCIVRRPPADPRRLPRARRP